MENLPKALFGVHLFRWIVTYPVDKVIHSLNNWRLVSIPHESSAITGDVYNSIEGWLNLTCFKLSQRLAGKRRE